jgi:uncharacterized repeat protein (TIGR03803 family)
LYGTTTSGGANTKGTIFKIDMATFTESIVYSFLGSPTDGLAPHATLVTDGAGNFYGTTSAGGANTNGTIFKFNTTTSAESVIYTFGNVPNDGALPYAGLTPAAPGIFYGTTYQGGNSVYGTVYKINVGTNVKTNLHSFNAGADGAYPVAGLTKDPGTGNFYGLTSNGGIHGFGTIFKIDGVTDAKSTVYNFAGTLAGDGAVPMRAALVSDGIGMLYGTTANGGINGKGTIFKFDPSTNTETVLYSFGTTPSDGTNPYAGLLNDIAASGNLYGTTYSGGSNSQGTVFKFNIATGVTTIIYSFGSVANDGKNPIAGLLSDGTFLYGTTYTGGANNRGTVFKIPK